jgi:hypothetical protein
VDVYRTWVHVAPNAGTVRRSLNYLSFGVTSVLSSLPVRDADVVIASTPQFFAGLAGTVVRRLKRRPLLLLNIGGGTAIDSLNALLMLRESDASRLRGTAVSLAVLDLDDEGPRFGGRALAALQEEGGSLCGVNAQYSHVSLRLEAQRGHARVAA